MVKKVSDREILDRCRNGNEDGWKAVYQTSFAVVSRSCKRYAIPHSLTRDIVQYSLLRTIQLDRISKVREPDKFLNFISRCAQNDFFTYVREDKEWINRVDRLKTPLMEERESAPTPERHGRRAHEPEVDLDRLLKLVKKNSGKRYPILEDYITGVWMGGKKTKLKELAQKHDMPVGSVKTTITRCFKKNLYDPRLKDIISEDLVERFKRIISRKAGNRTTGSPAQGRGKNKRR